LLEVAKELNKPVTFIIPLIKIFEDNLYDTFESIKELTDENYRTLNIPLRIQQKMKEKLG
jgi:hypothetical protein